MWVKSPVSEDSLERIWATKALPTLPLQCYGCASRLHGNTHSLTCSHSYTCHETYWHRASSGTPEHSGWLKQIKWDTRKVMLQLIHASFNVPSNTTGPAAGLRPPHPPETVPGVGLRRNRPTSGTAAPGDSAQNCGVGAAGQPAPDECGRGGQHV